MNSLKKGEGVPLLNFEEGPGVPLLNFEGGPRVLVPILHHAFLERGLRVAVKLRLLKLINRGGGVNKVRGVWKKFEKLISIPLFY